MNLYFVRVQQTTVSEEMSRNALLSGQLNIQNALES